ncbi:MAG: DUF1330 domain-containing protein [Bacteroidota bacterium]
MATTYLDGTREQFKAFMDLPEEGPFHMLNLLKFKETVDESGKTGREQYNEYMRAAAPFLQKAQADVLYYGEAQMNLVGPAEEKDWDKVLIVSYANKEAFANMVTHPDYPTALRNAALADSRLLVMTAGRKG